MRFTRAREAHPATWLEKVKAAPGVGQLREPYHGSSQRFHRGTREHGLKMMGTLQALDLGGMYQRPSTSPTHSNVRRDTHARALADGARGPISGCFKVEVKRTISAGTPSTWLRPLRRAAADRPSRWLEGAARVCRGRSIRLPPTGGRPKRSRGIGVSVQARCRVATASLHDLHARARPPHGARKSEGCKGSDSYAVDPAIPYLRREMPTRAESMDSRWSSPPRSRRNGNWSATRTAM
jgi:hypothetical protein